MEYYSFYSKSGKGKYIVAPKISDKSKSYTTCTLCGTVNICIVSSPIYLEIDGKGRCPDIIECGEYPFLIVSDKFVDCLNSLSITGYNTVPVRLMRNNQLIECDDSNTYLNLQVANEIELDLDGMGISLDKVCSNCLKASFSLEPWDFGPLKLNHKSEKLPDIFTIKHFPSRYFITKKVLEKLYSKRVTNISIKLGESCFDYFAEEIDIKKLFR